MEISSGVATLIGAAALWSQGGAVRWALLGCGLLGLSPWPGPGAIVRREERHPGRLIADPERRRARMRRTLQVLVPAQMLIFAIAGYVVIGVGGAVFMAALGGLTGLLGAWLSTKLEAR